MDFCSILTLVKLYFLVISIWFVSNLLGICGGSASGKTTVAEKIIESLGVPWVTLLSMDSFYKVLNEKQHEIADRNEYNFDHPDAFDFELLWVTLQRLKEGRKVEVPIYNFLSHSRESRTVSCISTYFSFNSLAKKNVW